MNKILKALLAPMIIFMLHVYLVHINAYSLWDSTDIPMHFLGGAAIGYMFTILIQEAKERKMYISNKSLEILFVLSFVALVAVLWEFLEYLVGASIGIFAQRGVADTMGDLLMGLLGAPLGYFLAKASKTFFQNPKSNHH